MGCAASSISRSHTILPLTKNSRLKSAVEDEKDELTLEATEDETLIGGQSTRRPSQVSNGDLSLRGDRVSRPNQISDIQDASRGASASTNGSGRKYYELDRYPGLSSSTSKTSLTLMNANGDNNGQGIVRIPSIAASSRRSSGAGVINAFNNSNESTSRGNLFTVSPAKSAADIITGLGWGHGPHDAAVAVADSMISSNDAKSENVVTSWHSLRRVTEYLSPAGSVELVNFVGSLPAFSGSKFTVNSGDAVVKADSVTAEDIIDTIKSRHDDEGYSIEEFTASAAFGIQLNVDHPMANSNSKSVLDVTKSVTSSEDLQKPVQQSYALNANMPAAQQRPFEILAVPTESVDKAKRFHLAAPTGALVGTPTKERHSTARRWTWGGGKDALAKSIYNSNDECFGSNGSLSLSISSPKGDDNYSRNHFTATSAITTALSSGSLPHNDKEELPRPLPGRTTLNAQDRTSVGASTTINPTTISTSNAASSTDDPYAATEAIRDEMPRFEKEIKRRMYPVAFRAGDIIIVKHDIGKEMFFLSKGRVEVISADGRTVYSTINRGSFFGELGVLFNVPRTASVRAVVDCFCMVLTRESLEEVLQYFPHIAERFRSVAEQRMKEVSRKRSYRRMIEVKTKMDVVDELPEETTEDHK